MKTTPILILAVLGCLTPYAPDAQEVKFDFGSTLNVTLTDTLDARKNKSGDIAKAKVTEDLKAGGNVVIPRGARLTGHVTEAQAAAQGDGKATLGLTFDRVELKDGQQIPLQTGIYALAAPEGASGGHGDSASGGGGFNSGGFGGGAASSGSLVSSAGHAAADDTGGLGSGARGSRDDLKSSPGAIGGVNSKGLLYASSRGVFGIEDVTLQPGTTPGGASATVVSSGRTVHLAGGTRMLLSVQSPAQ